MDLFEMRVVVALANEYHRLNPIKEATKRNQIAVALSSFGLVGDDIAASDLATAYNCFWKRYSSEVSFYPVDFRCMVNAPPVFRVHDGTEETRLFYDSTHKPQLSQWRLSHKNFRSYVDDIVLFQLPIEDHHINQFVSEIIMPGSTLTLVYPAERHCSWISALGYTLNFESLAESLAARFTLRHVHKLVGENVVTEIIGVEGSDIRQDNTGGSAEVSGSG